MTTTYRYRSVEIRRLASQAPWRWLICVARAPDGSPSYEHNPKADTLREARAIIARDLDTVIERH